MNANQQDCAVAIEAEPDRSTRLRILTLNIHKGFSAGNLQFTLHGIRARLRETGSNLVFLQEVSGEHEKRKQRVVDWPEQNQFEFLADSVWDHFAYGQNAVYQHGHHGNAILSEIPLKSQQNIDISTMKVSQRGLLHGELSNGVHLFCVHLGLFESERGAQLRRLVNRVKTEIPAEAPLIIAGDFNDWRRSAHRQLTQELGLLEAHSHGNGLPAATFPALFPLLPMDRIYLRGFAIDHCELKTDSQWRSLSDHCALLCDATLL